GCTLFRHLLLSGALLGLAAGCGGSSPAPDKELETVRSWTATATLAADERRARSISGRYVRGLVEAARAARADAARSLAASASSASDRARADLALDSLDQAIGRLAALETP
ncbi:MAG: hypothetical protein ACJ8B6_15600, partial [Gemmatimonadales bacterium]